MSIKSFLLIIFSLIFAGPAIAVKATNSGSGSNNYMFIDNEIDQEFFISSSALDPRFSGANVWTQLESTQTSLGYMGFVGWLAVNSYADMWITNSPITQPFRGIRCMSQGANCSSSGAISADVIDNEGFYHAKSGDTVYTGVYGFASLSNSAYSYFNNLPINTTETYELNYCTTAKNYDYKSGQRCKDLASGATWNTYKLTLTKTSHLTLKGTGAMAEIWVASDGTPSVSSGSDLCKITVVSGKSGLACKMIDYQLRESKIFSTLLTVKMKINNTMLGFTPAFDSIKYSSDGNTWNNFDTPVVYNQIFTTSGKYVTVFLSNDFFKQALNKGTNLTNKDGVFTFYFSNSISPESGFYQFTPSTKLNILPREYGISIVSTDGDTNPKASGKIGDDSPPIEFEYKVTTSAARQADSITAQVKGESVTLDGVPYCLFKSPDKSLQVPIPAYLSWISSTGGEVKVRNSCSEAPVDMTDATWVQTAWNASVNDGFFFTTNLKLLFPMNDVRSKLSVNDEDWMGTVSASGTVEVTAKWIGVDK